MGISKVTKAPSRMGAVQMCGMESDGGIVLGWDGMADGPTVNGASCDGWFLAFDCMLDNLEYFVRSGSWRVA